MSFRTRILVAGLLLAVGPLAFFGLRARREVATRLRALDERRVSGLAAVIQEELGRQSDAIGTRLDRLAEAMADDNRLRLAVRGDAPDRGYLLDYAAHAMRLSGLDLLRVEAEDGRILSSGQFRNEYDTVDPELPEALRKASQAAALVSMPTASGSMLALARTRVVHLGVRRLTLVGGTRVDRAFLDRLGRGTGLDVRLLDAPGVAARPGDTAAARAGMGASRAGGPGGYVLAVPVPAVGDADGADGVARIEVRASTAPLAAVLRGLDRWLMATLAAAAALALLLALLASARLSGPVAALADKAERLDLDRLDVPFATDRDDEIGTLSRVLDRMAARLRAGAGRLREAERRATIGEVARQVNHDVRNGLIPIRNVVGHLAQLARERPDELAAVFRERQETLESSIGYLQALAANYARLSPRAERRPCDLNGIVREVARETRPERESAGPRAVALDLQPGLAPVQADPVALRRIVENLVVNALESLEDGNARVRVSTRAVGDTLVLDVADTGRGIEAVERARIFDDFYTTKPQGTGLGLSIVRRLVNDLGGRIGLESTPGVGTRFTVELPRAPGAERVAGPAGRSGEVKT